MPPMDAHRRETLKRLSGLTLAQALPLGALADAASLNSLPRVALVIGNSAYRAVPELKNPANDAGAIAGRLKDMRFKVISLLDTGKPAMETAIREYCDALAKGQSVGLFYFAGHGFQMGWKNYLVPVDAALAKTEDIAANTIDLTTVLEGLRRAGNPMNIVILDACRDNPFGADARSGKGLSQVDAPVGTLLAYATSPGNTASDGNRDNGLYTENLLREMQAPDTKVEDIFKRVRLSVRRASSGQQIPWESTSLEDDFYFIPPASLAKASRSEADRKYAEELSVWQRVEAAVDAPDANGTLARNSNALDQAIAALEGYLRRYPSGHFSELAQVRLDRLLAKRGEQRILPVTPPTPFTQGTVVPDTNFRIGDWYDLKVTDVQTGLAHNERRTVSAVTDVQVIYDDGALITDPLGNLIRDTDGRSFVNNQHWPSEYVVGKRWTTRAEVMTPFGPDTLTVDYAIKAREKVTVPAGTFDAFRAEGSGWATRGGRREYQWWAAPDMVRRFVKSQQQWWDRANIPLRNRRIELVSFLEQSRRRG